MPDLLIWQLIDSAFPTGAFAHSAGLEAAWQFGAVADAAALRRFVEASVAQVGRAVLPMVNTVHVAPAAFEEIDDLAEAFLTNPVSNRASRQQGRTLGATAVRVWATPDLVLLKARVDRTRAHLAPVTGAVFRALEVPLATAQRMVLFSAARSVLSAAVRLGIAGSYEAQHLQFSVAPWIETVATRCAALGANDLTQTAPLVDVLQAQHDRLYSRLFQS